MIYRIFDPLTAGSMIFPNQNVPRWIIFLIDTLIVCISLFSAYMLRFEFTIPKAEIGPLIFAFPIYMIIRILSFLLGKTYAGIIRFTGTQDSMRLLRTLAIGSIIFALFNPLKFYFWDGAYFLPYTIIILDFLISAAILITFRVTVKMLYIEMKNPRSERQSVVIYGAGEAGVITKRTLDRDAGINYNVVAFVDDDKKKRGKRLEGAPIFHTQELGKLLEKHEICHLIISIQNPDPTLRRRVIETALQYDAKVLNVPPADNWINGELSFKQIKDVRIEDLLGRNIIKLDDGKVEN